MDAAKALEKEGLSLAEATEATIAEQKALLVDTVISSLLSLLLGFFHKFKIKEAKVCACVCVCV